MDRSRHGQPNGRQPAKQPNGVHKRGRGGKKRSPNATRDGRPSTFAAEPGQPSNHQHANGQPSNAAVEQPDVEMEDATTSSALSTVPYSSLQGKINEAMMQSISLDLKFTNMTPIQAAAIEPLLVGKDILGQARTGTGKTFAFLIPAIETALSIGGHDLVSALILTPTRELALQIAAEAEKLTSRLPQIRKAVCTAIGGTNKKSEEKRIHNGGRILIATPGRLLDHLQDEEMQYRLRKVQTLVLDEADRMLDMGFLPDLKKIMSLIPPKEQRQSLLFSATVPDSITKIAESMLRPDFLSISTIPEGEMNTHKRVQQYYIEVPEMSDLTRSLIRAIQYEQANTPGFKAIIFAPTAVLSDWYTHVLSVSPFGIPVLTMHSRMSQSKRISTTAEFKNAKSAICVATDVIARGMDFPLVTHVFQVGLPMNRESYIHRLGRTARAEASGKGVLILANAEKPFLRELKDVDFSDFPIGTLDYTLDVSSYAHQLDEEKRGKIYQGWLGYYKAMTRYTKWSSEELVAQGNKFAMEGMACPEVPGIEKKIVGKMGLKGVKGLKIVPSAPGGGGAQGGRVGGGAERGGGGAGRGGGGAGMGRGGGGAGMGRGGRRGGGFAA